MNPDLALLQPYPFEKLRLLFDGITPARAHLIALSIGEPKHPAPQFVLDALTKGLRGLETYPSTRGTDALREAIANWLLKRFSLSHADTLAAKHILPVNGTREALFAIAQCVLDRRRTDRKVLMPNPFYQIYEGAALLAGCEPEYYPIDNHADDNISAIDDAVMRDSQLIYICNPANPTGSVLSESALQTLIERAHRHHCIIVSDECYCEIYRESSGPPCGLLQAAHAMGNESYQSCLVFHSLSKRSNLPGMRSGFVAGDAELIKQFLQFRTYHGCSMPPPVQCASVAAWGDETHVQDNRQAYDAKYNAVFERLNPVLPLTIPAAGFYLWPELPMDDQLYAQTLFKQQNVAVVPGSYLGREVNGVNPGKNHVRLALVAPLQECVDAADRIASSLT